MKALKVAAVLLLVTLLLAGCYTQVRYSPDAVLVYKQKGVDVQAQLTQEETRAVVEILDGKKIEYWIDWNTWELKYYGYGCSYSQNLYISIGGTVYYISDDGCGTVRIGEGEDVPYFELTYEEEQEILELFRKYTGLDRPY